MGDGAWSCFQQLASLQKVIRHNRRSANYHVHRHVGLQSGDLFREQNNIRHLVLHVDGGSPSCGSRPLELLQGFFSQDRILRDGLDLDHTLVGLKPDLAECGQVVKTLADVEVARVVDGGLGAERLTFFVIVDLCTGIEPQRPA
jgi:hypothetical protein